MIRWMGLLTAVVLVVVAGLVAYALVRTAHGARAVVPDVTDQTHDQAVASLLDAGFCVRGLGPGETVGHILGPHNMVYGQVPSAGEMAETGSTVGISGVSPGMWEDQGTVCP